MDQGVRMTDVTMKNLLEAGVHFGHQTSRWNPKMKPYIFGARNGIYIIDLQQTVKLFRDAYNFVRDLTAQGGQMLFVGTKKQAQDAIRAIRLFCAAVAEAVIEGRNLYEERQRGAGHEGAGDGAGGGAQALDDVVEAEAR